MQRRAFIMAASLTPWAEAAWAEGKKNRDKPSLALEQALRAVETRVGGRLGVAALDTGSGRLALHRGEERFALCSTFKLLLAAQVLRRVDQGAERLDHRIAYTQSDLVEYSPVTGEHAQGDGMTVGELCEAAMVLSDNTAANLLLARQGGPEALTAWVRSLGDRHTRLDRNEPGLNDVPPGEVRDTTTPLTMLHTLQAVALGEALSPASRERLQGWMLGNRTGDKRLRAGVPQGWRVGEKTGTGPRGTSNDIGVLWPTGRVPVVLVCYLTGSPGTAAQRDAAIAEVARRVAAWVTA